MANHSIFLVCCLASILFSIDCASSLNLTKNETAKASNESVPILSTKIVQSVTSSASDNPTTTTPKTPSSSPTTTTITTTPSTTTTTTTTTPSTTTSKPPTTKPSPSTSTIEPSTPTTKPPVPPTTPSPPPTTTAAPSKHDKSFDFPSFVGGAVLSLGLAAIGYVVYKFYRTRTDPNYRSL